MRIRGVGRLRQAAGWLKYQAAPGCLVLLYHRVAESSSDRFRLNVTPRHFAEHLEVVRRYGRPVSLRQLIRSLRNGERPRRAVVVTFDDGYADNLHNAKPLLEQYEVPATVFITTGQTGSGREFWWDELERLLLQPGTLPEMLRLRVGGSIYQQDLGEAADYGEDAHARHRDWSCYTPEADDPGPRQRLYRELHQLLRPLPYEERQAVLNDLRALAGADPAGRPTHHALSSDEVSRLAEGGLIEVGAHTVTHPVLSALPADAQRNEIRRSKIRLEEILNRPVTSFAYPFGGPCDYTAETAAAVREAGFDCACSTITGVVRRDTDFFQLPRVIVSDGDGESLARVIRWLKLEGV